MGLLCANPHSREDPTQKLCGELRLQAQHSQDYEDEVELSYLGEIGDVMFIRIANPILSWGLLEPIATMGSWNAHL